MDETEHETPHKKPHLSIVPSTTAATAMATTPAKNREVDSKEAALGDLVATYLPPVPGRLVAGIQETDPPHHNRVVQHVLLLTVQEYPHECKRNPDYIKEEEQDARGNKHDVTALPAPAHQPICSGRVDSTLGS